MELQRGTRKLMGMMDVFTVMIVLMVSWVHNQIKTYLIVPFNYVQFIVCQLYFKNCLKRNWKKLKIDCFKIIVMYMHGTRLIFLEFNFIFIELYFTYSKIHQFNTTIFSFGNNIVIHLPVQSRCRTFSSPQKVSLCPVLFFNLLKFPLKFLNLTL